MTLRVGKLVYGIIKLLPCLLAVLLASSCSSDVNSDEQKGNKTLVTLTIAASGNAATASRAVSGNSSTITRAGVSDPSNKDYYIKDLTVLIFDESGDVIGSTTKQAPDLSPSSDGKITIQVLTRAAKKCTVYAIANALALNNSATPFAGVATLSALQSKVKTYKKADDINKDPYLLMMGKTDDKSFDTTNSGSAAAISLQRLASRIDFNFTVNNDKTTDKTTGFPIVVDSYQLCNVPTSTLYQQSDFTNPSMPSGSESTALYKSQGSITSSAEGTQKTYTCYVYTNTTSNQTYLQINAHSVVTGSDGSTYKVWNSVFHVNMPEKVKPNMHYTVNITINGGATHGTAQGDCGVVATYNAYPYFSGVTLNKWQPEEHDRILDLQ
jgi:hypothetical protein